MTQKRELWDSLVLSRPHFWMVWWCHGIPRVFISIFFLFRTKGKKGHLDKNEFRHCYGTFFKNIILKLLNQSYIQSSVSTCTRLIDSSILTPYRWRFHGNGSTCAKVSEKHDQTKIDEGPWKNISYIIWACTLKNIAP